MFCIKLDGTNKIIAREEKQKPPEIAKDGQKH